MKSRAAQLDLLSDIPPWERQANERRHTAAPEPTDPGVIASDRPRLSGQNAGLYEGEEKPWEGRCPRIREVLTALKNGPKTTADLLGVSTHRFACDIHTLRQHGWEIRTEQEGNRSARYTLIGWQPVKPVSKAMQHAYYKSTHWMSLARERRQYDDYQCVMCHSRENLNVHHWEYDLFNEQRFKLMTLCRDHHAWIHGRVKIGFPKSVPLSVWERLRMLVGEKEAA